VRHWPQWVALASEAKRSRPVRAARWSKRHLESLQRPTNSIKLDIMPSIQQKYKTIRHYQNPGDCHELTFSCFHRIALLTNDPWRELLADSIDKSLDDHALRLSAFVFTPEHVHLLVWPIDPTEATIGQFLKTAKLSCSTKIKHRLILARSPLVKRLTIIERPGKPVFRFWQEGPGYDRNLNKPETVQASINYIHENPVKRKLCRRAVDWRWSSARHYFPTPGLPPVASPRLTPLPAEFLMT
jgi:putative transposase